MSKDIEYEMFPFMKYDPLRLGDIDPNIIPRRNCQ